MLVPIRNVIAVSFMALALAIASAPTPAKATPTCETDAIRWCAMWFGTPDDYWQSETIEECRAKETEFRCGNVGPPPGGKAHVIVRDRFRLA